MHSVRGAELKLSRHDRRKPLLRSRNGIVDKTLFALEKGQKGIFFAKKSFFTVKIK
jgi:hypothetical protein